MDKKASFYLISQEADFNLDEIFDYTEKRFGLDQAIKYVSEFDDVFSTILLNPNIGRNRNEIKKGLYSVIKDKHIVFYRILSDYIRIVKIIHGRRDVPRHFK